MRGPGIVTQTKKVLLTARGGRQCIPSTYPVPCTGLTLSRCPHVQMVLRHPSWACARRSCFYFVTLLTISAFICLSSQVSRNLRTNVSAMVCHPQNCLRILTQANNGRLEELWKMRRTGKIAPKQISTYHSPLGSIQDTKAAFFREALTPLSTVSQPHLD